MNRPRIAVVILTIDQRHMTLECLRHLFAMTGPEFDVVVWDNGSADDTIDAVTERYPGITVHRCDENLGVAKGRNAAAALAVERHDPEYLLFLDNDIEVEPNFLQALLEPLRNDPRVGQTQAKLRFYHDRQRLNDGGGCRISFWRGTTTPVGIGEIDRGQYDEMRDCIACGGAMLTRTKLFQQLDGFDPRFNPVGPEDLDYSLRLHEAGFRALFVPQAVGYHHVSHTFGGGDYSEEYAKYKARNWFAFLRRHAPLHQKLGFFLISAPVLVLRMVIREGGRGNFHAIRGMLRGLTSILRGSPR